MIDEKIINVIKNAHFFSIINFRHYLDKIAIKDLLLSSDINAIKIWNIINLECMTIINDINKNGFLFSACFLCNNKHQNYIITSNYNVNNQIDNSDPIKVYDFNGKKIKNINNSNEGIYIIDTYYDINLSKTFIVTGNDYFVKSYDYNLNKIYHIYLDENNKENHINIIIDNTDEIVKLIEASENGIIRIWNFHSGIILSKLNFNVLINSICFWNTEYLFLGCRDKTIKLIDLRNKKILTNFKGHNDRVVTIKKVYHPKYGYCLVSQNLLKGKIKLWGNKYYNNK
jgi:hypothetical protein